MPQVENLVCGGCGDRKIACETLINERDPPTKAPIPEDPDFPAESFRIPREEEQDWVDKNAFLRRKLSTKGNSQSQRMSMKTKASIFGLPEIPNAGFVVWKSRPTRFRFFPKPNLAGKRTSADAVLPEIEPVSPKVSCMGRVKLKDKKKKKQGKQLNRRKSDKAAGRSGFWTKFAGIFRLGCRKKRSVDCIENMPEPSPSVNIPSDVGNIPAGPPSLGSLKKFASGRNAASMGSVWEFGNFELATEEGSDAGYLHRTAASTPKSGDIWLRRTAAEPRTVDCVRDWQKAGPATV